MNRLATQPSFSSQQFLKPDDPISLPFEPFHQAGAELAERAQLECRPAVFCPLHYERGYAYPLIVWLHADGGSELDLRRVLPSISLRNYVAVGPRGTHNEGHSRGEETLRWSQTPAEIEQATGRVSEAIEFVRSRFNVSTQKIFLAGRGAGGTMALRLACQNPDWFAGAISLDGPLPRSGQLFGRVNELREMPLLLSFDVNDANYDDAALCEDLRLLHSAGMCVSLRQYRGSGLVQGLMLADVDRWIMSIICPAPSQARD